jgi:hypothetical protein
MRISFDKKIIFLSNPQCASTSIRRWLDPFSDIKGSRVKAVKNHISASELVELSRSIDLQLDDFFVFSTTRNPWDKLVSRYYYGLRNPKSTWHARASLAGSFKDFLLDEEVVRLSNKYKYENFMFHDGNLIVKAVVRVESFYNDLKLIADRISVPLMQDMHANRNKRPLDYRKLYDNETREFVANEYRCDINEFGYEF